jgi:nucleotide-binding universal stress UspA family protein
VTLFHRILVATDFSDAAEAAWRMACRLAGPDTTLHAVNVVPPLYPDVAYANLGAAVHEQRVENERRLAAVAVAPTAVVVQRSVRVGDPGHEIVAAARETGADVVVVGVHRAHGIDHVLRGSVAERVVREAPCHVLLAKLPSP